MHHAASLDGVSHCATRKSDYYPLELDIAGTGMSVRAPTLPQILLCAVGAFIIAIADRAATYAQIGPLDWALCRRIVIVWIALLLTFMIGETLMSRRQVLLDSSTGRRIMAVIEPLLHGGYLRTIVHECILSIVMMLCWLPYILLLYPGLIWYDTGDQIAQFFGYPALGQPSGIVSSHHPVFDTIVFGAAARIGELWLGGFQAGLTMLIVLQAMLMCVLLSACVLYVRHAGAPLGTAIVLFLFFAVFPVLPVFFMSLVKDSFHAVFFVPWLLMYIETCRTRLSTMRSVPFVLGFVALSVLSSLTTATGFYIIVLSLLGLPFIGVLTRECRLAVARVCASIVTVVVIIAVQILFPAGARLALNIHKEDPNQVMVVPMQLTARYVVDHPNDITDDERRIINAFNTVPVEQMPAAYNPYLADSVIHLSLKNPAYLSKYVRVWAAQGLRHPESYINAFIALESGWFALERTPVNELGPLPLDKLRQHDEPIPNRIVLQTNNSISPSFFTMLSDVGPYVQHQDAQQRVQRIWDHLSKTPVIRWATYTAVWAFILPLFMVFCMCRNKNCRLAGTGVIVWSLLSLLPNAISLPLKPTASRYIIWACYALPVYLALLRARCCRRG